MLHSLLRFLAASLLLYGISLAAAEPLAIVPQPAKLTAGQGEYVLPRLILVTHDGDEQAKKAAELWAAELQRLIWRTAIVRQGDGGIHFTRQGAKAELGQEGYMLTATATGVTIQADADAGLFYGGVTLRQLLPAQPAGTNLKWSIPAVAIEDKPQMAWRGLMLDSCRHFQPADFVKKYIDLMALHKLNRLQWHLTEDQGWRIEIKKYPKLTEIGSKRAQTVTSESWGGKNEFDGLPHEGFYTQAQIRELVAYAAARNITIMPEIEMPGHALAALAAYPEFSCTGGPFKVMEKWGVADDVFCLGNDQTLQFLRDVLDEVTELFPSHYIHLGGDEAPVVRYKTCPKCQARMQAVGIAKGREIELQRYLYREMSAHLAKKGRCIIGWDDITEGALVPGAAVMIWRHQGADAEAARAGHDLVMAAGVLYLDSRQENESAHPLTLQGYHSMQSIYQLDPVLPPLRGTPAAARVLGAQCQLWTEFMYDTAMVEYLTYPRACALAEMTWSQPDRRDYQNFLVRMQAHGERLRQFPCRIGVIPAPRFEVGGWNPADTPREWTAREWTAKAGDLRDGKRQRTLAFLFEKGEHGLDFRKLEVKAGGQVILAIPEECFAGGQNRRNTHAVTLPADLPPETPITICAEIRGSGGSDSKGAICL